MMSGAVRNDPLVKCPYEPSHVIFKSRVQYHLVKCAKNHPDVEKEPCPYNATHLVPKPELGYHLETCPDQRILEEQKYQAEDEVTYGGVTEYIKPSMPSNDESWDDADCNTYDPSSSVSSRILLRSCPGKTKSARKQFYIEERKRVADVDVTKIAEPIEDEMCKPLRLPRAPSLALQGFPIAVSSRLGMGRGLLKDDETSTRSTVGTSPSNCAGSGSRPF